MCGLQGARALRRVLRKTRRVSVECPCPGLRGRRRAFRARSREGHCPSSAPRQAVLPLLLPRPVTGGSWARPADDLVRSACSWSKADMRRRRALFCVWVAAGSPLPVSASCAAARSVLPVRIPRHKYMHIFLDPQFFGAKNFRKIFQPYIFRQHFH